MINVKLYISALLLFFISSFCAAQNLEALNKQKPFAFNSGLTMQTQFYKANGIDPRRETFSYMITGSPVVSIYGFSMPFFFALSNQHSRVQQPLNHFGIKPYYKWAKFHVGHSSIRFSPFTLDGHRFLGVGTELNPGLLRVGAVYGRFKKAVAEDTTIIHDPSKYLLNVPIPSYSRKGYAFKLGVGTQKNHFDLILFKAKDDMSSIQAPENFTLLPEENAVLGVSSSFQFFKKLTWNFDFGLSANTRNLYSDTLDTRELDEGLVKGIRTLILPRSSTQLTGAGETSLAYKDRNFSIKVLYRRVDPEYRSMGVYYLQKDMEQYSIAPAFSLWKRKIRLSGTFGIQRNNLYDSKSATTRRVIGSANCSFNPGKVFGINMNYSNFGITQNPQAVSVSDTALLEQISQNFTISPRITLARDQFVHTFLLYGNYVELSDRSESILYKSEMQSRSANLTYMLNWIPRKTGINTSFIYRNVSTVAGDIQSFGFNAGINKRLIADKYSFTLNYTYFTNTYSGDNRGSTHQIRGRGSVYLFEKHQFFIQSYYLSNSSDDELLSTSFSEFSGTVGCSLIFSNR